jgi:hypothetical protein
MLLKPYSKPKQIFQEKFRIHSNYGGYECEWWGDSNHPHLSFREGGLEIDTEWYEELDALTPGLYVAVCSWYMDYESGEYGTILSQWPEIGHMQFVKMEKRAWLWYWATHAKETLKEWKWWIHQLFRKVWGVTESDGTIGHWLCNKSWLPQAVWIWGCAELNTGSKPMIENRWFEKQSRVEYRIERDRFAI